MPNVSNTYPGLPIWDMHKWFRQYAQQMGMQNTRALLPEQIDLLINTSITDTINQIIQQSIGITNDRIISDNSKIGQINALKTLYTVKTFNIFSPLWDYDSYTISLSNSIVNVISTNWRVSYDGSTFEFTVNNTSGTDTDVAIYIGGQSISDALNHIATYINTHLTEISGKDHQIAIEDATVSTNYKLKFSGYTDKMIDIFFDVSVSLYSDKTLFELTSDSIHKALLKSNSLDIDCLFYVDFSLDYKSSNTGIPIDGGLVHYVDRITTKYFPVRLIDDAFLSDALNDYILSPKLRSPVLTVNAGSFELYFDEFKKVEPNETNYVLNDNIIPYTLRISYIAKPAKVAYKEDVAPGTSVHCNLPEYLQYDILKHAVDLYRQSISGSLLAQQAQDQNQQREIVRNQAVPSNGYNNNPSNQ